MIKQRKNLLLIVLGLFIITTSQVLAHYMDFSDLLKGVLTGLGLGLMIVALINSKKITRIKN